MKGNSGTGKKEQPAFCQLRTKNVHQEEMESRLAEKYGSTGEC